MQSSSRIQRQPGTNTMEVADAIKRLLPTFRTELPPSVRMEIFYDRSDTIQESFDDVTVHHAAHAGPDRDW